MTDERAAVVEHAVRFLADFDQTPSPRLYVRLGTDLTIAGFVVSLTMARGRRDDELCTPVTKGRFTRIGPDNRLHVSIPVTTQPDRRLRLADWYVRRLRYRHGRSTLFPPRSA